MSHVHSIPMIDMQSMFWPPYYRQPTYKVRNTQYSEWLLAVEPRLYMGQTRISKQIKLLKSIKTALVNHLSVI